MSSENSGSDFSELDLLRVTLSSIGDGVITTDAHGKVTMLNPVAEQLTGWTQQQAVGQLLTDIFQIVNQDTREKVENPALRALRDGVIVGLANHTILISRDGSERYIDDSAAPIRHKNGQSAGAVLIFRDISERKEAEKASARLAAIVTSSGDAIISKDLNGIISSWNKAAERLFGYAAQEAVGRSVTMLIPPERLDEEPQILNHIRRGESVDHYETIRRHKDGRLLDISLTVSPMKDGAGQIIGASKIARDISERKRREANLAFLADVSQDLTRMTRPEHTLKVLGTKIGAHFNVARAMFAEIMENEDRATIHDWYRPGLSSIAGQVRLSDFVDELFRRKSRDGETIVIEDVRSSPLVDGRRLEDAFGILSFINVPIVKDARWVFGMGIYDAAVRVWREDEIELLEELTRRIWLRLERARAEEALQVSEEKYRTLFESMDEGYCVIEFLDGPHGPLSDYVHVEANPAYTANAGIPDIVGKKVREIVPDEADGWVEIYRNVLLSGKPVRFERELVATGRFLELSSFRIEPVERRQVAVLFKDITERRRAERTLHDSETRFRRLFETAADGILIFDAQSGQITDANVFMGTLMGSSARELIGRELHEVGLFADAEESKRFVRDLQQKHYVRHEKLPMRRSGGGEVDVELVCNVYHEGQKMMAQCNIRDISQRVVMEKKIKEQTEQLAWESRRKDEFLAMLSHELRNPLAPIRSAVHLLRTQERGSENAIQKQAHQIIDRQVGNLTKLISDLLEVSRVVSGRIHLNQQIVDINQIVRHAIETVMPIFEQRKHTLAVHHCSDPVWVSADATRLEAVFINLLNNAAKYTPDGGRIEISCESPKGTGKVHVRIRDNGMGIDAELLPRIFDLFTQADRSLARSAGGLGIGLSLAHRLIELHGGKIEALSDGPGKGAEFIVTLDLVSPSTEIEQSDMTNRQTTSPNGVRVLVVDDNMDQVIMLASYLRQLGYIVQSAYSGPEGLKLAREWHPNIILLDIGLPGLDGYEVARQIRAEKSPELKKAKLIALTGYGRETDLALATEAGFNNHLVKPYELDELERLMTTP